MRSKHLLSFAPLLLAASFAVGLATAADAAPVGFLAVVEDPVERRPAEVETWLAAAQDAEIGLGDTLRTGREGLAKLVLTDDTVITLDEETELRVDREVAGSAAETVSKLHLLAGHARTRVSRAVGGPSRVEMITPTAVIGVKGTEWLTWILDGGATFLCVVSGAVSVSGALPGAAASVQVPAGSCAVVSQGRPPRLDPDRTRPPAVDEPQGGTPPATVFGDRLVTPPGGRAPDPGDRGKDPLDAIESPAEAAGIAGGLTPPRPDRDAADSVQGDPDPGSSPVVPPPGP